MTETLRRGPIKLGAAALLLFALVNLGGAHARDIDLGACEKLQVEEGHKVAFVAYAEGVQIYKWNGTAWSFVGPEAILYSAGEEDDEVVGIHYGGPTWESNSGSKVVGAVVDKCPHDPNAIPWLLLRGVVSNGPGIFNGVSFIQRLYTVGGLAPTDAGDFVGEEARVPYTAWYVFYRKHQ